MAVTSSMFSSAPLYAYQGSFSNFGSTGTVNVCLVQDRGSVETHQNDWTSWTDIGTSEGTGAGYTAGGQALATKALTVSGLVTKFDADDTIWGTSTITAKYAVVYNYGPGSKLVSFQNFGTNIVSSNGSFKLTWGAGGIFTDTVAGTT